MKQYNNRKNKLRFISGLVFVYCFLIIVSISASSENPTDAPLNLILRPANITALFSSSADSIDDLTAAVCRNNRYIPVFKKHCTL